MIKQPLWPRLRKRFVIHLDPVLLAALGLLILAGLVVL